MNTRLLSLIAALALSVSVGAMAQSAAYPAAGQAASPSVAASAVGHWLHDSQGNTIGSVRGLADGGRTAVIMVGSYFRPGSYEARVPADALSVVDSKVTLRTETVQALNAHPRSRG
jgi:hypothetical protein